MFILPFLIFSFIFLGILLNIFTIIYDAESKINSLEKTYEAYYNLIHCARIKATYLNIESSYIYLSNRVSKKNKLLLEQSKNKFLEILFQHMTDGYCYQENIPNIFARAYRQNNDKLSKYWPNWSIRFFAR